MRRLVTVVLLVSLAAAVPACSDETFATATSPEAGAEDSGVADVDAGARPDACATTPCTPPHDVVTVATGQGGVDGLVVTPLTVAWATPGAARTCPLTGPCDTPFTLLAVSLVGTLAAQGEGVLMPDVNGASGVIACATGKACTGGNIGSGLGELHALVAEGNDTYVVDAQGKRIAHCASATGCGTWESLGLGTANQGSGIAVNATRLYWTFAGANGLVYSCLRSGCAPTPFASSQANPRRVAADSRNMFWTSYDDGSVWSCPVGGCSPGGIKPIATGQDAPLAIATDGAQVYWTTYAGGTVMRCEAEGCKTPRILVQGLTNPSAIALSQTDVYIASGTSGTVIKIAK
jgi:hypothetical protein